jgi:hypothetical protein
MKMIPLMIVDLAYTRSFDMEREVQPAALETGGGATSDDDDDEGGMNTALWSFGGPETVPVKDLATKIPSRGKSRRTWCMLQESWVCPITSRKKCNHFDKCVIASWICWQSISQATLKTL